MVNEPAGTHRRAYGRSLADFEPLLPAEEKLVWAAARGVKCERDVVVPGIATNDNRIRAGFLRFLALGGDETTLLHEKGVWLQGAFIEEEFDLTGANLPANLTLWSCRFNEGILASGARTRTISFDRSSFATITAYGAQIGGGLSLQGVHANGEVLLLGAHIDRDLECDGGTFENPTGKALFLDRAKIGGGVFLKNDNNQPFHAKGEVCLGNARIGGNLECNGGTFENPTGKALFIERAKIGGGVFMSNADNQPFHAIGEVRLVGARIVGTLVCDGGQFENPGVALNFDGAQIGGSVFLRYADSQPFQAKGEVRLLGAHIGGTLACIGQFENPGGNALSFDRAQIRGSVFLGTRGKQLFRALGEVRLPGAHIDGSLVCGGDLFHNPYRDALVCNNSVVK